MASRTAVADSSSIILLQKVRLLGVFLHNYHVIIPGQVYDELTGGGKKGADELGNLLRDKIRLPAEDIHIKGLDRGESGVMNLYIDGGGDFVLLDDKKGAKYCTSQAIPFINALLLSRILYIVGAIEGETYKAAAELLIQEGYYSDMIIKKAAAIRDIDLQQFMPL